MDTLLIYTAGLFDGEGCIMINRTTPQKTTTSPLPRYRLICSMGMVEPTALTLIHQRFGGSLNRRRATQAKHRDSFTWCVQALKAQAFLEEVFPYLIVKKKQAEIGLTLQKHLTENLTIRNQGHGFKCLPLDETIAFRDDLYDQIRALNRRGIS